MTENNSIRSSSFEGESNPSPISSSKPPGAALSSESTTPVSQQAGEVVDTVKKQVTETVQEFKSQVQDKSSELVGAAKDAAIGAAEQLRTMAEEKKNAGADFGVGIADAIRRAAGELDGHIPQAGDYIRSAADQIEEASDALRRRDFNELISSVQGLARRQPTAFLGATVLAGFIAVRFYKSATAPGEQGSQQASRSGSAGQSGSFRNSSQTQGV